ncbi:MAG: aldehyde dehydrogenase family protein [Acidimicrobiia bacterium]|nr:aldehyde dehydrogenase family protein [Acidimicrobiia bacterium]
MDAREHFYIDGRWQQPASGDRIDVHSAATEDTIGHVPRGTPEDVDRAVAAARRAFDQGWALTGPAERADWLRKLADALERRVPQIADTIAREVGMPITMSTAVQAELPVKTARSYAQLATGLHLEEQIGNSIVTREPFGVAGMITPWNYPLHQIMAKVAPAIAAGCTMVLKPSEVAPLNSYLLAEAALDAGLPAGVLNIVHGEGPIVGEAIANHPGVDMISFTGSIRAGQRVAALAAATIKKVTLELGGKSAFIVLDDAPLEKAVARGVNSAMLNSGQTCSAWTRMIVPRARMNDVLQIASGALAKLKVGDPLDADAKLGPLVSELQRHRVEGYIQKGLAEGARLVAGGGRPPGFARGHYVEPTIFADVGPRMTIAQEEIFGPVLAVLPYDTEDEAIAIANDTIYGLAGGVWGGDTDRALRVARRMRTGQVDVNGGRFNPLAPFGGYKWSGIGREFGKYGLEEYLQIKAIQC